MKDKLLAWLFRGYAKNVRKQAKLEMEARLATFDLKDIVRARLKGLRPGHPDDDRLEMRMSKMETPERLDFLSKAHDVSRNRAFREIARYIIEEAEHKAVLYAKDMSEVNFQRAVINGVMLVEEELARLSTLYMEEKKIKEQLTDAERFSAL